MTARVLALDLSLAATGRCNTDGDHDVYHPTTKGDHRLRQIPDVVLDWTYGPDLVVMEDCLVRTPAAAALAMLHGAIRYGLITLGIPYLLVSPATLKTYGTGRGNAPKPDMRMELFKRTGLDVADDNAVDARWLWYLAHDLLGEPVLDLPQTHRRALAKLNLPEGLEAATT